MPTATAGKQSNPYSAGMVSDLKGAKGAQMDGNNFELSEIIYSGGDDPEPGTKWRSWWDGNEPKIPSYYAHLLWWSLWEASDCFISPDRNWCPPDAYKIIDNDLESAVHNITHDLSLYLQRIASLPSRHDDEIPTPYEFESLAHNDQVLTQDRDRATAAYTIYCFDKSITGLLSGNVRLVAMGSAYAYTCIDIFRHDRPNSAPNITRTGVRTDKEVRSELGRHAASIRHVRSRAMKGEAIRLYCENSDWPSRRQASKAIYPLVQAYGKEQYKHQLSADRAEQTIYEWLSEHDKQFKGR